MVSATSIGLSICADLIVVVRQMRQYHLYTNLFGFSNPAMMDIEGVKVGVIVFDASLVGE